MEGLAKFFDNSLALFEVNPVAVDTMPFSRRSSFIDVVLLGVDTSRIVIVLRALVHFFVGNPVRIVCQPGIIIVRVVGLIPISFIRTVGVDGYGIRLATVSSSAVSSLSTAASSARSTPWIVDWIVVLAAVLVFAGIDIDIRGCGL